VLESREDVSVDKRLVLDDKGVGVEFLEGFLEGHRVIDSPEVVVESDFDSDGILAADPVDSALQFLDFGGVVTKEFNDVAIAIFLDFLDSDESSVFESCSLVRSETEEIGVIVFFEVCSLDEDGLIERYFLGAEFLVLGENGSFEFFEEIVL
jgi:hypothetical protein